MVDPTPHLNILAALWAVHPSRVLYWQSINCTIAVGCLIENKIPDALQLALNASYARLVCNSSTSPWCINALYLH